jgi:hypothetical protein
MRRLSPDRIPRQVKGRGDGLLIDIDILAQALIGQNHDRVKHEGHQNIEIDIFDDLLLDTLQDNLDQGFKMFFDFRLVDQFIEW